MDYMVLTTVTCLGSYRVLAQHGTVR